jgi:hypothetical protein
MIVTSPSRAATLTLADQANNPFVAWDNLAATATLSGSAPASDGAFANAVTGTTYDFFTPASGSGTVEFRVKFGGARAITFAGIAAHNLGEHGLSARVQYSLNNGATWADGGAGVVSPDEDSPIGWRMDGEVSADFWRIAVTGGSAGRVPSLGVVFFGDDLVIPTRIYEGFAPRITPTEVALQSNVSIGNHLLGSSVVFTGSKITADFTLVPPTFIRGGFKPFQTEFNQGKPCFFGWRPEKYAEDLHYGWRDGGVIRPDNTGPKDYMGFNLDMRCHDG